MQSRDMVPHIKAFADVVRKPENSELGETVYVVAHKDMQFAILMVDHTKGDGSPMMPITGVLDWEFSGIAPINRRNSPRVFL